MSRLMIIGCGGVASVAIHKCCQNREVFDEIMIASRTVAKCDALKEKLIQDGQVVDALSGNTVQGGQAADALS
ncbi:MAG: saccharopine dehydrogenase NADP-binding domain-containing protein, partial [Lachnospiraceae bacterium]|nr:saccharopine dehydrogenase NADP-binding domain-containing protein [Lachnospiraceae bacterium]